MVITRNYSLNQTRLNVRDYGAVGDGMTDDRAAIQAVFDGASNAIVYFPKGTYLIGATTDRLGLRALSRNIAVQGDGVGLTTLLQADAKSAVLSVVPDGITLATSNGWVSIRSMGFSSPVNVVDDGLDMETSAGSLVVVQGATDSWLDKVQIDECHFNKAMRRGIWSHRCRVIWITGCVFTTRAGAVAGRFELPNLVGQESHIYVTEDAFEDPDRAPIPQNFITDGGTGLGANVFHYAPAAQPIPAPANPTGRVSAVAVNGIAASYMRSDAAPAIDMSMSPVWLKSHQFDDSTAFATTVAAMANAHVGIGPGTSTAVPLRLTTSGAVLVTGLQTGAIETDGTSLFFTNGAGVRKALAFVP